MTLEARSLPQNFLNPQRKPVGIHQGWGNLRRNVGDRMQCGTAVCVCVWRVALDSQTWVIGQLMWLAAQYSTHLECECCQALHTVKTLRSNGSQNTVLVMMEGLGTLQTGSQAILWKSWMWNRVCTVRVWTTEGWICSHLFHLSYNVIVVHILQLYHCLECNIS